MLNFDIMTDRERREAAAIEGRRMKEEERKKRIFNPRQRLIGVDYDMLQKQIEDKRKMDEETKRNQQIFEQQLIIRDQYAVDMERKERVERMRMEKEMNEFRKMFQGPESRREFDLNDPKRVRAPMLAGDEFGPSAAQTFEGEDGVGEDRLKVQKEQTRAWLDQQIYEKDAEKKNKEDMENAYVASVIERDRRAIELDNLEKECRKRMQRACMEYNQALANEKHDEAQRRQQQTLHDNVAEMYNLITSDLLTENPDVSKSNLGGSRQIGYLYKGMTPEQKEEVRKFQLAQIDEAKRKRVLEKKLQAEFDDYLNGTQNIVFSKLQEIEKKVSEYNKEIAAENHKIAHEQKKFKEFLDKVVYTNKPTEAYYDQFNTSTR